MNYENVFNLRKRILHRRHSPASSWSLQSNFRLQKKTQPSVGQDTRKTRQIYGLRKVLEKDQKTIWQEIKKWLTEEPFFILCYNILVAKV